MPTTRSQTAEEKATLRVYEDYPASPSEALTSAMEPPSTEPTTSRRDTTHEYRQIQTTATRNIRAPSIRSNRSTSSAVARIRQAELAAEEQLAEIRKQELQLQATLVRKKLAAEVAVIREETDRESMCEEEADAERRVSDWLERTSIRGERNANPNTQRQRSPQPANANQYKEDRRPISPMRTKENGLDKLANTMEKIMRSRPPPRQTQELPLFSGGPGEWLPFKAAMRESSELYGFTPAENLARLRSCLRGEARQTVSALLYTATDPTTIMKTLEQCYGRPEIIIDNALEEIRKLPRVGTSAGELNTFAIKLQNIVTVIGCLDERGYLQNPMLTRHVTEKLSPHVKSKWCDYAEEYGNKHEPEIVTLSRFLMREADRAVRHSFSNTVMPPPMIIRSSKPTTRRPQNDRRREIPIYATSDRKDKKECFCCGEDHETPRCRKLTAMTVPERWNWAKEIRICFLCLNNKHRRYACKVRKCGVQECRLPHHALLHHAKEEEKQKEESVITASTHIDTTNKKVLLKVCPITIQGENEIEIETYALLDEGSTITLIDEEIANKINAQGPVRTLNIHSVTSNQKEPNSRAVDIKIKGKNQKEYYPIKARTVKNLTLGRHSINEHITKYDHLRELRDVCYEEAKPRVLIGADQWHLIVTRRLLSGKKNQPAASLTKLGWIIHGILPRSIVNDDEEQAVLHVRTPQQSKKSNDELYNLVKAHFEIDALGVSTKKKPIATDERAKRIFNETVKHLENHYEVGLPWTEDKITLPPSYDMALQRLRGIERKMNRSPEFKEAYTEQVNKLIEKKYAAKCETTHEKHERLWYLPHFAVTNPNKPQKIRMVFDAAAKANGICLNDFLLDGPDLLQNLHGVLFRFREKPVALTADIREMFLQVKIRKEDQMAQHFLWRENDKKPPTKYVMNSMIFGARSSPFIAHSVRNKNASEHKDSHPLAYKAITNNHYMDDWVESYENKEKALQAINEVEEIHKKAGFTLAGWSSNEEEILSRVKTEDQAKTPKEIGGNVNPYAKTLGILWMATSDELAFNTNIPRIPEEIKLNMKTPTKREALGTVMSIFDPLGLLSPYTITAKIIIQNLWRQKMDWDDPLPTEEAQMFEEWLSDLPYIKELRVPRCYEKEKNVAKRQLHVFCDASEQAYATAAYWRLEKENGEITVILVAGKAKVAPLKAQSIPRMELQACLIGARLANEIMREHEKKGEIFLWSDSKTTLHWIKNDSQRYTPYVAHRLSEIAEITQVDQWRWVPTTHNVADDATRPGNTQLKNDSRWYKGPSFLHLPKEDWPQEDEIPIHHTMEIIAHMQEKHSTLIRFERFSNYKRLLRAIAYVLLFINKCRKNKEEISIKHINQAEKIVIKEAQQESFHEEIEKLKRNKNIEKGSKLYKLDPKMKEDGIIRLHGRINAANVPEANKEPPILDGAHHLTKLIIKQEHEEKHHTGREHIVNILREKYWILRVRPVVKNVLRNCTKCRSKKSVPEKPVKGDLPNSRLNINHRPFSHCGLDCFGPMWVTIGRRREKRWGMLFTCLTMRAIHIELISSLSTDSAIMALRRMASRRGWPDRFISDNGTNFHGADAELKQAYEEWLPEMKNFAISKKIDWRYIDPGAPNQGGAWERMLTHVPVEPDDEEALTPNHFLLGTATGLPYVGECETAGKQEWRTAQAMANMFWAKWVREYLPTLTPRREHRRNIPNVKTGDIVIIADGLLPRNIWPYGRVTQTYDGPDGVVRSAEVLTRGGIFRRPVRRLIVLPTTSEGCEDLRRGENVTDDK